MNEDELEREKTQSFELGHIDQLKRLSDELRERSGELWAEADSRTEIEKARLLKNLAGQYETRATDLRETWDEKYKEGDGS